MVDNLKARQHAFPCQQCGAQLDYKPGTDAMECGHCGHQHRISLSLEPIQEYDFHSTLKHLPGGAQDTVVMSIKCHACSAEFEFDQNVHSDECPFCGSRIVVDTEQHRVIQPKALLPFRITDNQATDAYKKWLKRLWFAPNKLKKYARNERKLNGVYVPYWTYDSQTVTRYSGQRGDAYQVPQKVSVVVNGKRTVRTQMVTKIRWTPVSGLVQRSFDDVLVYATNSLPRNMARELAPWDMTELTPFQEEFLSGFQSEVYKVELDRGFDYAKERMKPLIHQDIRRDIGGDQQRINGTDIQYSKISFKHVLLPFWIAGFRFRKKTYQFIVNGRTGEVQGDRPYSRIKIALTILLAIAAVLIFVSVASESNSGQLIRFDDFNVQWNQF